jgi:hypothetical protein
MPAFTYAQPTTGTNTSSSKEAAIELNVIQTSLVSYKASGINFNIKYFPRKRFATGAYLLYATKKIPETFTYSIARRIIQFYEIGWTNQYNFLLTNRG